MKLTIEATNICPLPCHDSDKNRLLRERGVMDTNTFKSIMERCKNLDIQEIKFGGSGEALLNPDITDFINHINLISSKIKSFLVTNGTLLSPKIAESFAKANLKNIEVILSPPHVPLTTTLRGSAKGRIYENITLVAKIFQNIKIVHALPQWSDEQRQIVSQFWRIRGISKVFFGSRLACGVVIKKHETPLGLRPPTCALFRGEHYITWNGKLISCCHDRSGETEIGDLDIESPASLIEKKKRITDRQFCYPICYECDDDRRYGSKGGIQKVVRQAINILTSS